MVRINSSEPGPSPDSVVYVDTASKTPLGAPLPSLKARHEIRRCTVVFDEAPFLYQDMPKKPNNEWGHDQRFVDLTSAALLLNDMDAEKMASVHGFIDGPHIPTTTATYRWPEKVYAELKRIHPTKAVPLARLMRYYHVPRYHLWTDAMSGYGLYQHISRINHSCEPNCVLVPLCDDNCGRLRVLAQRDIEAGEQITVAYTQHVEWQHLVNVAMAVQQPPHQFQCTCDWCFEKVSESQNSLERFLQEIKAHGVERGLTVIGDDPSTEHTVDTETMELLQHVSFLANAERREGEALIRLTEYFQHQLLEAKQEEQRLRTDRLLVELAPSVARWLFRAQLGRDELLNRVLFFWLSAISEALNQSLIALHHSPQSRGSLYRHWALSLALAYCFQLRLAVPLPPMRIGWDNVLLYFNLVPDSYLVSEMKELPRMQHALHSETALLPPGPGPGPAAAEAEAVTSPL